MSAAHRLPLVPRVTLLAPIRGESEALTDFLGRLRGFFTSNPGIQWQALLLVPCNASGIATDLEKWSRDARFEPRYLSANVDPAAAVMAAAAHCDADAVIGLNPDLQDPLGLVAQMILHWSDGADIVVTRCLAPEELPVRGSVARRLRLWLDALFGSPPRPEPGAFCLIARPAMESLRSLEGGIRVFPGALSWEGFRVSEIAYSRPETNEPTAQ